MNTRYQAQLGALEGGARASMHGHRGWYGRRVAITGGTSGLGLALVKELRTRGAEVAFVARHRDRVERVAAEMGAHGIVGDVSRKDDIHPIALQIVGRLGGLDALVNNASSLGPVPLDHEHHIFLGFRR